MRNQSLGETIRSLRKKAGLTQEDLADGICSPVSISRIENGSQMPSGALLDAILSRLGTSTYQICDVYYKNEQQMVFEQEAEKIMKLISMGNMNGAREKLFTLQKETEDNPLNLQHYLLLKASVMLYEKKTSAEVLDTLYEALSLTKSNFDYTDFRGELLSVREANILNIIVVALYHSGKIVEAIQLGEELMSSLNRHKSSLAEYQVIKINLAFNLAQCMEKENRYREALHYSQMAEEMSLNSTEQMLLPEIEFIRAKAHHYLGNDAECEAILRAVVPYMDLIRKTDFAALVRNYAKKELNIQL